MQRLSGNPKVNPSQFLAMVCLSDNARLAYPVDIQLTNQQLVADSLRPGARRSLRAPAFRGFPVSLHRTTVFLEFLFGPWGGRPTRHRIDATTSAIVNFSNNPIEIVESEYPLMIERYGYVSNSGGAGKFRGWLALVSLKQRADCLKGSDGSGRCLGRDGDAGVDLLVPVVDDTGRAIHRSW
jgi:hypothetical protein